MTPERRQQLEQQSKKDLIDKILDLGMTGDLLND